MRMMIVNLTRHEGDTIVDERIDCPLVFDGGQAVEGVLVEFELHGRPVTGRIRKVLPHGADDDPALDVVLIDREALDAQSEITLANLPPKDDFTPKI